MKKIGLTFMLSVMILLSAVVPALAADNVAERPNIKIVIDGKTGIYAQVPIIVNDSSLLPLRALLNNLGITDENIIWNGSEKSVTVFYDKVKDSKKERTKIYLQVGNVNAYVNETTVKLDAAPVIYNNSTYIPTRFVAQSLGKKVVWDGATSSVLIRDENEYNKVKEILDKSNEAMAKITKFKFTTETATTTTVNGMSIPATVTGNGQLDTSKLIMHMNTKTQTVGQTIDSETYLGNNALYIKNPLTNKWMKMIFNKEQFMAAMANTNSTAYLKANEVLYAGLIPGESSGNDIMLKGSVYLDQLLQATGVKSSLPQVEFNKFYMEIYLDKTTFIVNRVDMDVDMSISLEKQKMQMTQKVIMKYSDYNGNFDVVIPDEVIKNAQEVIQ